MDIDEVVVPEMKEKLAKMSENIFRASTLASALRALGDASMVVKRENGEDVKEFTCKLTESEISEIWLTLADAESKMITKYSELLRTLSQGNA